MALPQVSPLRAISSYRTRTHRLWDSHGFLLGVIGIALAVLTVFALDRAMAREAPACVFAVVFLPPRVGAGFLARTSTASGEVKLFRAVHASSAYVTTLENREVCALRCVSNARRSFSMAM